METRTEKYKELRESMRTDVEECIELIVYHFKREYPNEDIQKLKDGISKIIDEKVKDYDNN